MIGTTVSHYRILEKLGEGGMGVVFKAQDLKLDRVVALKFLPATFTLHDEKARFVQEAKAASALNHPNILTIHDIDEADGRSFMVMELIEGTSLKSLSGKGRLSVERVLELAAQLAEGLARAHEKGIIHRDIKSDNVMVTSDGLLKIMDFGLAKLKGGIGLTKAGSTVGTVAYMAPEQINGEEVNERADIWSFGVVLYELLTGRLPFRGEHDSAMMYSIVNEEFTPLKSIRPDVPGGLEWLLDKCLQKDPSMRYDSMDTIVADVRRFRSGEPGRLDLSNASRSMGRLKVTIALTLAVIAVLCLVYSYVSHDRKVTWARMQAIPEILRLIEQERFLNAYLLAQEAEKSIPEDSTLIRIWPQLSKYITLRTDPPGASLSIADYSEASAPWVSFGQTPLDSVRFPTIMVFKFKLQKAGFRTVLGTTGTRWFVPTSTFFFKLDENGTIPEEMVRVEGGKLGLNLSGLEGTEALELGDYFLDRYEVTNKEYKRFVDAGGYERKDFWKHKFVKDGEELSWGEALALMKDKTGRQGPSTWEVGTYPEGQDDYPVTGVSWHEAAAYAEFAGKSLPSVFHWNRAAGTFTAPYLIPESNFRDRGPEPVGKNPGISSFGAYDMAGNAREWCFNLSDKGRFILGGGWNDQTYVFTDSYTQPPFDRSVTNGFRCVKYLEHTNNLDLSLREIKSPFRDFLKEKPVSDQVYRFYLSLFGYDRTKLNPRVEGSDTTRDWVRERISFSAAYGNDRVIAYLFLPRTSRPPYQTVVFFPGSNAINARSGESMPMTPIDFIIRSGRAVMCPIYNGTYERSFRIISDQPNETNAYKEWVIQMAKDLRRSLDYLETRNDIDKNRFAYYGLSWGGRLGGLLVAIESRFKTCALYVAGLKFQRSLPEVDPFNYVSRIKVPVLMLNGRYDQFFPLETSQKPMLKLLGTPPQHKRYVLYETGHFVPRIQLMKEVLDWFDHYMGPVENWHK